MSLVTVIAGRALVSLSEMGCSPDEITEILAEMCKLHEEVIKEVDEECPMR